MYILPKACKLFFDCNDFHSLSITATGKAGEESTFTIRRREEHQREEAEQMDRLRQVRQLSVTHIFVADSLVSKVLRKKEKRAG